MAYYTIYHADGTPELVQDNEIDDAFYNRNANGVDMGVGVRLIGRNRVSYGAAIAQNFLQQAENFASLTIAQPPSGTALQGQLWFEKDASTPTSQGKLFLRVAQLGDNAAWHKIVVEDASGNSNINNITISGRGLFADGSASVPSIGFTSDIANDTGFYHSADGYIDITNNGTRMGYFNTSGFTSNGDITTSGRGLFADGSASVPSIGFTSDIANDTGFYHSADGYIDITNNGTRMGYFNTSGLTSNGRITATEFYGNGAYLGNISVINPATAKDGDIKVVGAVIYIYASAAWQQVFPAVYS